jgi:hypothetical protein
MLLLVSFYSRCGEVLAECGEVTIAVLLKIHFPSAADSSTFLAPSSIGKKKLNIMDLHEF